MKTAVQNNSAHVFQAPAEGRTLAVLALTVFHGDEQATAVVPFEMPGCSEFLAEAQLKEVAVDASMLVVERMMPPTSDDNEES